MKFIDWNEDVSSIITEDDKKKLFIALLGRPVDKKWDGKIKRKEIAEANFKAPFVELRKRIGDANVLLRYGRPRPPRHWPGAIVPLTPYAEMSMNGKAQFDPSDFTELSMAVDEARRIYEAVMNEGK